MSGRNVRRKGDVRSHDRCPPDEESERGNRIEHRALTSWSNDEIEGLVTGVYLVNDDWLGIQDLVDGLENKTVDAMRDKWAELYQDVLRVSGLVVARELPGLQQSELVCLIETFLLIMDVLKSKESLPLYLYESLIEEVPSIRKRVSLTINRTYRGSMEDRHGMVLFYCLQFVDRLVAQSMLRQFRDVLLGPLYALKAERYLEILKSGLDGSNNVAADVEPDVEPGGLVRARNNVAADVEPDVEPGGLVRARNNVAADVEPDVEPGGLVRARVSEIFERSVRRKVDQRISSQGEPHQEPKDVTSWTYAEMQALVFGVHLCDSMKWQLIKKQSTCLANKSIQALSVKWAAMCDAATEAASTETLQVSPLPYRKVIYLIENYRWMVDLLQSEETFQVGFYHYVAEEVQSLRHQVLSTIKKLSRKTKEFRSAVILFSTLEYIDHLVAESILGLFPDFFLGPYLSCEAKRYYETGETILDRNKNVEVDAVEAGAVVRTRKYDVWSDEETNALISGIDMFGESNWTELLYHFSLALGSRKKSNVFRKWRTMKVAAKRVAASNPSVLDIHEPLTLLEITDFIESYGNVQVCLEVNETLEEAYYNSLMPEVAGLMLRALKTITLSENLVKALVLFYRLQSIQRLVASRMLPQHPNFFVGDLLLLGAGRHQEGEGSRPDWSDAEVDAVVTGIHLYGYKWTYIMDDPSLGAVLKNKKAVDIKTKWSDMMAFAVEVAKSPTADPELPVEQPLLANEIKGFVQIYSEILELFKTEDPALDMGFLIALVEEVGPLKQRVLRTICQAGIMKDQDSTVVLFYYLQHIERRIEAWTAALDELQNQNRC